MTSQKMCDCNQGRMACTCKPEEEHGLQASAAKQRLEGEVARLREALKSARDELNSMIDRHNTQSIEDGSWAYDKQTVCECDAALAGAGGAE